MPTRFHSLLHFPIDTMWATLARGPVFRSMCVLIFATVILIHSSTAALVQTRKSATDEGSVPTLRSFSQQTLPRGFFKSWCGMQDRYLMEVDQQPQMFGGDRQPIDLPVMML